MAVNLLAASSARVDFGDMAAISGLTAITVSFSISSISSLAGQRFMCQWGATLGEQAFIITSPGGGTDEIGFVVADGAGLYCGRQTTVSDLVVNGSYRVVCRWKAADKTVTHIWIGGVNQTVSTFSADNNVVSINNATSAVQVGRETSTPTNGIDGNYADIAIHSAYMPDDYCIAYGKGFSPAFYRSSGILYAPLFNTSDLKDRWGGLTGTNTGGTSATHTDIKMPRPVMQRRISAPIAQNLRAQIWM